MLTMIFIFTFLTLGSAFSAEGGLTVESYCQLVIEMMQKQIPYMENFVNEIAQYSSDPDTMEAHLRVLRNDMSYAGYSLLASYRLTMEEYLSFMGRNRKAVDKYLEDHEDIRKQIEDLSARISGLMEQEINLRKPASTPQAPPQS